MFRGSLKKTVFFTFCQKTETPPLPLFWPPQFFLIRIFFTRARPPLFLAKNGKKNYQLKSFNVIPGSLGDLAIVTWFWPQNRPFLTPPCPREKDGRGQSGPNSCFPINIDVIWGVQEFPRWFQGSWVTLPLWPDFDLKISHFWPPVHTGKDGRGERGT